MSLSLSKGEQLSPLHELIILHWVVKILYCLSSQISHKADYLQKLLI